jgi:molybdate transport repressor ModE-like protein
VKSVHWDDLRCLAAVQQHGSISAAARALGLGSSTLYRRITVLEQMLGEPCLVRGRSGATLSEAGLSLAKVAHQTSRSLDQVLTSLHDRSTRVEGAVSVTTVESLFPFIRQPITELCQKYPALEISLHLGDSGPSVRDREVDVALAIVPRPPAGCWGRRVARLGYGVFATKSAALSTPRRWVVRPRSESSPEAAWERANAELVAMHAPFHSLVHLCAGGAGLGLIPKHLAAPHPTLEEVREYGASLKKLERTLWILTHPDRRTVPRIRAVMSALARPWSAWVFRSRFRESRSRYPRLSCPREPLASKRHPRRHR